MKLTFLLLVATAGGPLLAYYGQMGWPWAALTALVFGALLVRWVRRQPHPRLDKARAVLAPRASSAKTVIKTGDQSRRQHGLASAREIRRHGGRGAVRRKTATVRPSLARLTRTEKARMPTQEIAVELASTGGQTLYASVEDVTLIFAGPRVGKSGWMACRVVDSPGPVVVTSIRPDLHDTTHRQRAERGQIHVFNAAGFPDIDTEVGFDPLTGCRQPAVAAARAADMIPLGEGDRADWAEKARGALGSLLHAAALGGHDMDTVHSWVANLDRHKDSIIRLLRTSSMRSTIAAVEHFVTTNDRTRSSITTSIVPALRWLENPAARRAAGMDGAELPALDAYALVRSPGDSLYILGLSDENTHVTPLMAALAGHIASVARDVARQSGGRLDPPLRMCLDEAAKVAPPLPGWTTDMGGTGITLVAAFQSLADLRLVWGKDGAARIMNNSAAKLLGGGTGDPDDLHAWVELAGNRDETVHTFDEHGVVKSSTVRQVPVLTASQLAHLPDRTVVVFRRGMRPTIGQLRMAWDREPVMHHLQRIAVPTLLRAETPPTAALRPPAPTSVVDFLPDTTSVQDTKEYADDQH